MTDGGSWRSKSAVPLKKCTSALISMKRDTLPAMFNHRRQFSLRRDTPPAMFNHMWFFHFNLVHIGITTTYAGPLRNKGCEPISTGAAPRRRTFHPSRNRYLNRLACMFDTFSVPTAAKYPQSLSKRYQSCAAKRFSVIARRFSLTY